MLLTVIQNILPEMAIGLVSAATAWVFSKRKYQAEASATEIENVDKAAAIWRELAESLKMEIEGLKTNQEALLKKNRTLLDEMDKLRTEMVQLETKVISLTRENRKLRRNFEENSAKKQSE